MNSRAMILVAGLSLLTTQICLAETPAQTCTRVTQDMSRLSNTDVQSAVAACSAAVTAAPQDTALQFAYARALESVGKSADAKQLYEWLASDAYAPAVAALDRLAHAAPAVAGSSEDRAKQLEAVADLAAATAAKIPRTFDDPNTVLVQTTKDPQKILDWVRMHTVLVPYAGTLRGASGVLMDRAGNSLDRALFLTDLLSRAGINSRIARTQLSPATAEALRARFTAPASAAAAVTPQRAAVVSKLGASSAIDPQVIAAAVDESLRNAKELKTSVTGIYQKVYPAVMETLGHDTTRDSKLAAETADVLRDHFWIQRQDANRWVDMDPDADVVGPLVATATFLAAEIPATLQQRVSFTVGIDVLKKGQRSSLALLQRTWLPAQIADKSITLTHTVFPQPDIEAVQKAAQPVEAMIEAVGDAAVVMPVLQVGPELTRGQVYDLKGHVADPTPTNIASLGGAAIVNANKLSTGIASVFGDSPAPVAIPAAPTDEATVVAEWLEIDITIPGQPQQKHRRVIYDAPSARSVALMESIDIYATGAAPAADWVDRKSALVLASGLKRIATDTRARRTPQEIATTPPPERLEFPLWGWALTRSAYDTGHSYITEPNVALLWQGVASNGATRSVFDIVSNGTRSPGGFAGNVAQGVYDSIVETQVVGGRMIGNNAALRMQSDLATGIKWSARGSGNILAVGPAGETGDTLATWWRVDASTGQTLSIDSLGRGASAAEYVNLLSKVLSSAWCFAANDISYSKDVAAAGDDLGKKEDASAQAGVRAGFCILGAVLSFGSDKVVRALEGAKALSPLAGSLAGLGGTVTSIGAGIYGLAHK